MKLNKELLDKRICDVEPKAKNTQTYREFIKESEKCFDLFPVNLDSLSDKDLNLYLNFLDELWDK